MIENTKLKLACVAITGPDDAVDITALNDIYGRYPYVEWALLYMPERAGEPRFPSRHWLDEFKEQYKGPHKSMHLCGSALIGFIEGDADVLQVMEGFKRIQLNLEFDNAGENCDMDKLLDQMAAHPEFEFIVQYTPKYEHLLPALKNIDNHAILFDTSAGRGVSPDSWPAPLAGHYCGYAGGLRPENIISTLENISRVAGDAGVWIDMETGVRTPDDQFDLNKVRTVLETAKPWIDGHGGQKIAPPKP